MAVRKGETMSRRVVPPALLRLSTGPLCDHGAPADWQLQSTHQTSAGTIAYARCVCGTWLVLLDGRRLGTARR